LLATIEEKDVLDFIHMIKEYLNDLKFLWLRPSEFFDRPRKEGDEKAISKFTILTGVLVALEVGLVEALGGGSIWIIALITALNVLVLPFAIMVWVYLWTSFVRFCAILLGETLPLEPVRQVVAYSAAGLVALGLGFGLGKWLLLAIVVFQIVGIEKALGCSRWMASIYVGLPFALVGVLGGLFAFMFKVF
jgi:hypothetical protein